MTREEILERDHLFCELLFELGSVAKASKELDISIRQGRKIADRNKDLILSMVNTELASMAYKAVSTIRDCMSEDGQVAKAEVRLKASEGVLDRIGASKKTTSEVEITNGTPIILMPAKDPVVIPTIKVASDAD